MKTLTFNFEEGKQRVIAMLEEHIESFTKDMLQDAKICIDRDEYEAVYSVQDILDCIKMHTKSLNTTINKMKQATSVYDVLKATNDSPFEDLEETILCHLYGLESVTRI